MLSDNSPIKYYDDRAKNVFSSFLMLHKTELKVFEIRIFLLYISFSLRFFYLFIPGTKLQDELRSFATDKSSFTNEKENAEIYTFGLLNSKHRLTTT